MYVTIVYVHVKPEHVTDFIASMRVNHEQSVLEPGNLRFDILQSADDPTRFVAYEAYRDEASAKAHKETAHYLAWRDAAADWMAEPRQGARYDGLFPVDPATKAGE
jgi:autoinducer 2-degrading protein